MYKYLIYITTIRPGSPDSTTQFPQEYRIDWVRVYQYDKTTTVGNISPLTRALSSTQHIDNYNNNNINIQSIQHASAQHQQQHQQLSPSRQAATLSTDNIQQQQYNQLDNIHAISEQRIDKLYSLFPDMTDDDYINFKRYITNHQSAKQLYDSQWSNDNVLFHLMEQSNKYNSSLSQRIKRALGIR